MTPQKIDRYEIINEIGRGGMATVYEANDPRFDRIVALKVLPREFMHDPEFRGRFIREAKTIAALEHPAIVPVYDFGEEDGQPFLVMRIMRGGTLTERMLAGPIPIEETAQIFKRVGSALDRAHSMGIVHRDMKPSNILFDEFGEAYLADFGIVQVTASEDALTASGSLVGTPAYMSPEQVYGDKKLDGRSDIYALGVILFQMLTGTPPYTADTPARMMMKHVMDPVPQVLQMRPDLPDELDTIIHKAMAKERDERFSTASDLSSALTAVTTKRTPSDEIHAELAAIRADYSDIAPPTPPPPSESTPENNAYPAIEPSSTSPFSGIDIPKWVIGIVVLLGFISCGSIGALVYTTRQGQLEKAEETAVALNLLATANADQATIDAMPPTETSTHTPAPTATSTAEPTNTPPPALDATGTVESLISTRNAASTDIDATSESLTSTRSAANINAEATRESLIATRSAAGTLPSADSPLIITNDRNQLFGPTNGALIHETNNLVKSTYSEVALQNFVVQSTFITPYDTSVAGWDFGVTFRQLDINDELRLVVRSDGAWNLNNRQEDDDNFVQDGNIADLLNLEANSKNTLLIIATDEIGYFFLNGTFVAQLDLSDKVAEGDIGIGTGYYTDNQVNGERSNYEDFGIWSISAEFVSEGGAMPHIDNGFIKTESTDLFSKNFVITAEFTNPYSLDVSAWDYGFSYRDRDVDNQYWFVVSSTEEWDHINRIDGEDTYLDNGAIADLNTAEDSTNQLTLIALEQTGVVFVNGRYLTTLDLSERANSGEISLITAFFVDHEVEGYETGYFNLKVWPLP